jgi:hypothetical protein
MKKSLVNAAKYLSSSKQLFVKGKVYEVSEKDWKGIPDKDKSLFTDVKAASQKPETVGTDPLTDPEK